MWAAKEWARVNAGGDQYVVMVHAATNEDKCDPTPEQLENICRNYTRAPDAMMGEIQWKLKRRDKSWRSCYKTLHVIDYLARNIKDEFLPDMCSLAPTLQTIAEAYNHINRKGEDRGAMVRERARSVEALLTDGLLLREERERAAAVRAKMAQKAAAGAHHSRDRYAEYSSGGGLYNGGSSYRPVKTAGFRSSSAGERARGPGCDPYAKANRGDPSAPPPVRTKEEQERYDMELALRMQREEERRSGVSTELLETAYARRHERDRQRAAQAPGDANA